jgi:hypothetical protein
MTWARPGRVGLAGGFVEPLKKRKISGFDHDNPSSKRRQEKNRLVGALFEILTNIRGYIEVRNTPKPFNSSLSSVRFRDREARGSNPLAPTIFENASLIGLCV